MELVVVLVIEVLKALPCEGFFKCCLFHIYAHHSLSTVDGFFREKLLERVVVLASLTLPERVLYLEIFRELFPFKNTLLTAHSQFNDTLSALLMEVRA